MWKARRRWAAVLVTALAISVSSPLLAAQNDNPTNDLPNPYASAVLELPGERKASPRTKTESFTVRKSVQDRWFATRCRRGRE